MKLTFGPDGPREPVTISLPGLALEGDFDVPPDARALVVLAHVSSTPRHDPRLVRLGWLMRQAGFAVLTVDLLGPDEVACDRLGHHLRLMAHRLTGLLGWASSHALTRDWRLGLMAPGQAVAPAMVATASFTPRVEALVLLAGRPDEAAAHAGLVNAPTLMVANRADPAGVVANSRVLADLPGPHALEVLPLGTGPLGDGEANARVAALAVTWFGSYLGGVRIPTL